MDFEITSLIPHRPPMLLIDKIVELDTDLKSIETIKIVGADEFFVQGHYPDFPIVPGVITCEMIFQTGAALMSQLIKSQVVIGEQSSENFVPVISRTNNTKFRGMIRPGDEVHLKVQLTDQVSSAYYLKGVAKVNGRLCASVDFTCMLAPPPQEDNLVQ